MNKNRGFTLVELLLYLGIVIIIIPAITGLVFVMLEARVKARAMNEINYQGDRVVRIINQAIRNSENVINPSKQNFSNNLSLQVADASKNPTIFDLSNGRIRVKEGVSSEIDLTNAQVTVSGLNFQNNGLENSPDSIQFQFQINFNNLEGRNEYYYSKVFYGSASLRK